MVNCKGCTHATVLYKRDKEDRYSSTYAPLGYVRCSGPRYNERAYFCRDERKACAEYKPVKQKGKGKKGGNEKT